MAGDDGEIGDGLRQRLAVWNAFAAKDEYGIGGMGERARRVDECFLRNTGRPGHFR